jgi:glycosyltransferase involved in cell wall biosynthesis
MKIALIGPVYPYRGGIAHYTASLAQAFQQQGHDVVIYSFSRQYPTWLYPGRSDKEPSPQRFQFPTTYVIDTLNPWSWTKTAALIVSYKPDLVIFQWWTTFMAPAFITIGKLCKRRGLPLLFLIHNVYPHEKRWFDLWLVRATLKLGDAYVVQSIQEKDKLLQLFPGARIFFHPHPVYLPFAEQKISKIEAKARLGLDPNLPVALFFGIVRPYKGLSLLLEAVAALRQQGQKIQALIAGEFWENIQKYIRLIERLEISDLVRLENRYIPNEEVPLYFSAADVFVAPYTAGTQSGAVKLAMGFGLPIVVSDILYDELLRDSGIAIAFSVQEPLDLTRAIRASLENELREVNGIFLRKSHWSSLVYLFTRIVDEVRVS